MVELGVNIDHVATLRQARRTYEPDPVWAAVEAELAGADAITVHLREDRRHINDRDVQILRYTVQSKLNLEMSIAPPIVDLAVELRPAQVTLVPERREELTTEGGINLGLTTAAIADVVKRLQQAGIKVSAFIDPDERQVMLANQKRFDAVELHTGEFANATGRKADEQLARLKRAGTLVSSHGMRLHAGHGLNYRNVGAIAAIPNMAEVNIGHAIVSRAIFVGLGQAIREMKHAINVAHSGPKEQAHV
jgi:pyridoxine 5-phosphate synthase